MPYARALETVIDGYLDDNGIGIERGDIVTVLPARQIATRQPDGSFIPKNLPVPMPRTGWIIVRGIPDSIQVRRFRNLCLRAEVTIVSNPPIRVKDRRFGIRFSNLPVPRRNTLINDRYINLGWDLFLESMRHKMQDRIATLEDF